MGTLMVHTISPHSDCTYHNSTYWWHIPLFHILTAHPMTPHTDSTYHNFAHWLCIPWLRILTAHTMTPHTDCIPQIHISTDYTYHKIIDILTRHTTNTHTPQLHILAAHTTTLHWCWLHIAWLHILTVHEAWHSQNQIHFGVSHPDCQHVMETGDNLSTIMSEVYGSNELVQPCRP